MDWIRLEVLNYILFYCFTYAPSSVSFRPGGGVLLGIFGGVVPPASPNPDPISDQKMPFPTPVFRPGLKNPYPFSDLTLYVVKHSICISAERKST